jgi:fumarate reductase flavoprotein subunit
MTALPEPVDIVVVGGGLAGHCAALTAAEQGATVLLLEKTARFGGSSIQSGGSFAFSDTEEQRTAGVTDSDELFARDMMAAAANQADSAQIALYLAHQHETHAWLKQQGVRFHGVSLSSNTSVPRTHPTHPRQCMEALHQRVLENPRITYLDNAPMTGLLTDAGRVAGIALVHAGKAARIHASRGVVLACGGFAQNRDLIARHAPQLLAAPSFGGVGNTGDGLIAAASLGAQLLDMEYVTGTFGMAIPRYPDLSPHPEDEPLLRMAIYRGAIVVNREGRRFADESISYKTLGTLTLQQPGAVVFQIFDQPIMDQSAPEPTVNDLKGAFDKAAIRTAPNLRALAQQVGLDPESVEQAVARYNQDIKAQGRDSEFGRMNLGKGWGTLVPIEQPPFYILPCSTGILATYCGVRVDTAMRVLNAQGEPIPGLHAAGELTGGFHGPGYVSGTAQGKAAIFGRLAGLQAASPSFPSMP